MTWREQEQVDYALGKLRNYKTALEAVGARIATHHATRVIASLESASPRASDGQPLITGRPFADLLVSLDYLTDHIAVEMEATKVVILDAAHSRFLIEGGALGEAVQGSFPDCVEDFEEAGKCLAFGLSTACVFHLMRAAEGAAAIVVKSFGGDTHKDDGEPHTFGGFFKQVGDKVDAMPKGPEKDAWNKLKGFMSSLNRGDRTKVAHPGRFYSEAQAERLLSQTRSFMEEAEELLRP
jgi:hypothetical protein